MSHPPDPLDERYGRRAAWTPRRRTMLGLLGVAVLVGLTVAVFMWSRSGPPTVTFTVAGYEVRSDDTVAVTFSVSKPDGSPATCRVQAQDRSGSVIGSKDVPLPAAGSSLQRTIEVTTRGRAVVGTVSSCTLDAG